MCWKCGQSGHIGDKCRQAVNILAESLASPAIGAQPSWAHVVKGGVSVVVSPPHPPPPRPHARQQNLTFLKLSSVTLKAGKSSLKHVPEPQISLFDPVGKVVTDPKHAEQISDVQTDVPVEASSMEVQLSFVDQENIVGGVLPPQKKAKISSEMELPRDPRLRAKTGPVSLSSSPVLYHKVSAGGGELQLGENTEGGQHGHSPLSEGEQQHVLPSEEQLRHGHHSEGEKQLGPVNQGQQQGAASRSDDEVKSDEKNDNGVKTNMFGVQFVMWFDVSIEGKNSMDPDEDDWGGRIEFGYSKKGFSVELQDYFVMFEDECSTLSHNCAGRIRGVLFDVKNKALKPPDYDSRSIIDLIEKYEDAHILDCGWREVDPEEWFE